jgi:hypothetical protein
MYEIVVFIKKVDFLCSNKIRRLMSIFKYETSTILFYPILSDPITAGVSILRFHGVGNDRRKKEKGKRGGGGGAVV